MAGAIWTQRGGGACALVALWAALAVVPAAAAAGPRSDGEGMPRRSASADTVEVVVVSERIWSPAVAVTLSFAGGYGDDPPGAEGTAWLLGMVLARAANANLAETGASVEIEVGATRTWVSLLTTLGDWATAYGILTRTLVSDPVDPALAEATRADLAAQLFFQRDAPVRSFELEAQRMLLGAEHRAARPPMGTPSTVSGRTVAALEQARERVYRPHRAGVAVAGAVAPAEAIAVVGAHRTLVSRAGGSWVVEGAPLRPGAPGPAWERGGRYLVEDEITNSWIVAAYPFPGAGARTPYEFVAHVVSDQLVTDPPAPGLISRRVEVRELPDGPVLLVTVAVESHTASDWEQRVADVMDRLPANALARDFVGRWRRSFRSATALELAYPEREARRLLTEAQTTGRLSELAAEMEHLLPEKLQQAAAGLGEPRVLVYGLGKPPS